MSSSLCFLCHSTVNSETSDEVRDKFKEVVGMHLSPHLCHICCHMVRKLYHFKATCIKRLLEYPVLFSEKGTMNLQKNYLEYLAICSSELCQPQQYPVNKFYCSSNSKNLLIIEEDFNTAMEHKEHCIGNNEYVNLEYDKTVSNYATVDTGVELQERCNENNEYVNLEYAKTVQNNETVKAAMELQEQYNFNEETQVKHEPNVEDGFNGESDVSFNENNDFCQKSDGEFTEEFKDSPSVSEKGDDDSEFNEIEDGERAESMETIIEQETETQTTHTKEEEEDGIPQKKHKKRKKRSFQKIVLTFKEQKAALEAQRKEKKYLEALFKCHSCALGFLFRDTYQSHMVRHEESNGQYNCNVCGLRFATQNARSMHVYLHTELYRCNKCSAEVKRPHRQRHVRDCWRTTDTASCHLCGKEFRDGNCLQQHLRRFHLAKSSTKAYPCGVCGKTYPDPGVLRTHMIKHINCRFPCDQCPATFTSPYTLNQHKKRHATPQDTLYYCMVCNTAYDTKKSLDAHLKNTLKHQQRSFECQLCPRKFPNRHELSRHAQTHSAPTACPQCGVTCRSHAALRRHERTHLPSAGVTVCHLCGKGFKCKSKLNRHVKEVCEKSKLEEELAAFYEQESVLEQINNAVGT